MTNRPAPQAAGAFIRANLRAGPVPMLPDIRTYQAHPASGLARIGGAAPYWAYVWAGGAALARHVTENPGLVRGLRVLDLGAGSGVVGIAAARAGAARVICAEIDPYAAAAIGLNAALNDVQIEVLQNDICALPPPGVDLILAGDVFYAAGVARRVAAFLRRCCSHGITVLVGDPGRAYLPRNDLRPVAEYKVRDFGDGAATLRPGLVYEFGPPRRG
ncbi:class I SAM-dependent methyltransferase [Phaeovulum sp.]|uniref:class I SAM-dependent methyltransferase n=1 Tax=Phaeovulum sp. TaxID=2934796 RepID=UPI0027308122|nr:50S ribosomal protein L11 methyltransferase [Phaeovulum sp.]MDP1669045.1 50S ribosomal protein L11 methyltransferase [Phaeovulum sp.]MDZ4118014.1 50S ribosomal protein L11 methyltransferase [Phaeovulum sp.]